VITINLATGVYRHGSADSLLVSSSTVTLVVIHALLMVAAWGILFPAAVLVARYASGESPLPAACAPPLTRSPALY
jgi:hypothetical protein